MEYFDLQSIEIETAMNLETEMRKSFLVTIFMALSARKSQEPYLSAHMSFIESPVTV